METKKLIVYSENVHDYYFLAAIEFFAINYDYNSFEIITYKAKLERVKTNLDEIIKELNLNVEYKLLGDYKASNPSFFRKIRIKATKIHQRLFDGIKLWRWLRRKVNNHDFLITEIQFWLYGIIINASMKKQQNLNIHNYLTIHNIDRFTSDNITNSKLLDKFNNHLVLSQHIKDVLKNISKKHVLVVPAALPTKNILKRRSDQLKKMDDKIIKFTVTGSIEDTRKDYKKIIDYFQTIDKKSYELVLLGKLKSKWVVDYAKEKMINFRYYTNFVSDEIFEREIINSHFLITSNNNDRYFNAKISGIIYDAIRYAVPLISNNETFSINNLQNIVIHSENTIAKIIAQCLDGNYLKYYGDNSLKLSENSIINFKKYI